MTAASPSVPSGGEDHPPARRILLVDDDLSTAFRLRATFQRHGHAVVHSAIADSVDLVVLDPGLLSRKEGLSLCALLRPAGIPLLLLSRLRDVAAEIALLGAGADDYLPKPVPPARVVAHAEAVLRRPPTRHAGAGLLPVTSEWRLNETGGCLVGAVQSRDLAPLELRLLRHFLDHSGEVLAQRELLAAVWGTQYQEAEGQLEKCVHRLRRKLEPEPARPRYLLTVRGIGYRYCGPHGPTE